jgi:N-acetylmuramoyl-L-alanine amidase
MLSSLPSPKRVCAVFFATGFFACFLQAGSASSGASQYAGVTPAAFAHAERLRESLDGRPEQQRTRLQYERVLDAYRAIYHSDPSSPKADSAVAAVADLLAEEGRVFQDGKALHDAIGQYEFLRHQYPASRYRFSALLTEGEIYQRDLGDLQQAQVAYQTFLRLYPLNPLRIEAQTELKKIRREEAAASRAQPPSANPYADAHRNTAAAAASQWQQPRSRTNPQSAASNDIGIAPKYASNRNRNASHPPIAESNLPPPQSATDHASPSSGSTEPDSTAPDSVGPNSTEPVEPAPAQTASNELRMNAPPPPRRGKLPFITGVRHWSTPDYTRVAIDLQQEVRYQAARVSNPDRIFFDLYGTRLSPELQGRAVEVTDEGFLSRIRAAQSSTNTTRIVLDVNSVSDYSAFFLQNPPRLIIDVHGSKGGIPSRQIAGAPQPSFTTHASIPSPRPMATARIPQPAAGSSSDSGSALSDVATLGSQPGQVRATRYPTTAPVAASVPGATAATTPPPQLNSLRPTRATRPSSRAQAADEVPPAEAGATGIPAPQTAPPSERVPNSMVRALGLKINRIVIDAGHGGHDSGTLGPGGLEEKDVVLDVALRLGRLLKQRLGADVIYTRSDDTFIPLETRTAIANEAQADLFISIHANSSSDTSARGVEVYYLNFTSSADALEVAARENAVSDQSIHELSDLVRKIALQDKINESRAFASDVDQSLYAGLDPGNPGLKDRGVKKAPFVVLIGANMPSILAEISFLTNPDDAAELRDPQYRQRIAESLYRGVSRYVSSLNGVRLAQAGSRVPGSE